MTIVVIYLIFSAISGGVFMIHVHGIAHQFRNPGGFVVERMEGSGDYLLLFLRSAAEFDPGIGYVPVSEGHYILFRKDCPQKYRKLDGMFINDWMHFDFDSYDSYFENLGIPFNTPLALPDNKPIFDLFMVFTANFLMTGSSMNLLWITRQMLCFTNSAICTPTAGGSRIFPANIQRHWPISARRSWNTVTPLPVRKK